MTSAHYATKLCFGPCVSLFKKCLLRFRGTMTTTRRPSAWLTALAVTAPLALAGCSQTTEPTTLGAVADQLGCTGFFASRPFGAHKARSGFCTVDGAQVALSDWGTTPTRDRDRSLGASYAGAMDHVIFGRFSVSSAKPSVLEQARADFDATTLTVVSQPKPASEPEPVLVGEKFDNFGFEATVTDIEIDGEVVDFGQPVKPKNGQWVTVNLDVTNAGKQPDSFSNTSSTLVDGQGREFTTGTMFLNLRGDESGEEFQPGTGGSIVLVFDVPTDVTEVAGVQVQPDAYLDSNNPATYVTNETGD